MCYISTIYAPIIIEINMIMNSLSVIKQILL
jgi:hypothetical protein